MSFSIAVKSSQGTPPCNHTVATTVTTVKVKGEPVATQGDFIAAGIIDTGSSTVKAEGRPVAYVGSKYTEHPVKDVVHVGAMITTGEKSVIVGT